MEGRFIKLIGVAQFLFSAGAAKFSHSMVPSEPKQDYNILCMHTRFNNVEMEAVMGKDTAYVTMLRDPIDVFESQWQFYGLQGHFGMTIGTIICCAH